MRLLVLLAILDLMFVSPAEAAQIEFHLGDKPSERARLAMPLAKCLWKQGYAATLSFADELERGMKTTAMLERLALIKRSCPTVEERGDLVAAIVHFRQIAVADCIEARAGSSYRTYANALKTSETPEARDFIERGFPIPLRSASNYCDASLTPDFAQQERSDFGARVFGWR